MARPAADATEPNRLTDEKVEWVARALGVDVRSRHAASQRKPETAGDVGVAGDPRPPTKLPPRGPYSEAQYNQWIKEHPNRDFHSAGPWMPEAMYKTFDKAWFQSKGFFLAGRMRRGSSGEHSEIWLKNTGDGVEWQVFRDPNAREPKKDDAPATYDPDEGADQDALDAHKALMDRTAEMAKVQGKLKELVDHLHAADFEGLRKAYIKMEADWQKHLHDDIDHLQQLLDAGPSEDSKPELEDALKELRNQDGSFPYGDGWNGRSDIPARSGDPIRVKPPVTVKGDQPITF